MSALIVGITSSSAFASGKSTDVKNNDMFGHIQELTNLKEIKKVINKNKPSELWKAKKLMKEVNKIDSSVNFHTREANIPGELKKVEGLIKKETKIVKEWSDFWKEERKHVTSKNELEKRADKIRFDKHAHQDRLGGGTEKVIDAIKEATGDVALAETAQAAINVAITGEVEVEVVIGDIAGSVIEAIPAAAIAAGVAVGGIAIDNAVYKHSHTKKVHDTTYARQELAYKLAKEALKGN